MPGETSCCSSFLCVHTIFICFILFHWKKKKKRATELKSLPARIFRSLRQGRLPLSAAHNDGNYPPQKTKKQKNKYGLARTHGHTKIRCVFTGSRDDVDKVMSARILFTLFIILIRLKSWKTRPKIEKKKKKKVVLVSCLFADMGYVWLVCVCALHMCVEAHSPQLDKSDHDHLDHRHRHLVSDDNAAPGMTLTLSMCAARCLLSCQSSSATICLTRVHASTASPCLPLMCPNANHHCSCWQEPPWTPRRVFVSVSPGKPPFSDPNHEHFFIPVRFVW